MKICSVLIFSLLALGAFSQDRKLDFGPREDFLDIVEPIITKGELKIYQSLTNAVDKRYFEAIFWHKRDPKPFESNNPYFKEYFLRRSIAIDRLGEGKSRGNQTDRGRILLLLGEPDDVKQSTAPNSGLRAGYVESWIYNEHGFTFEFAIDQVTNTYKLQDAASWAPRLESVRLKQILDRAEPYRLKPFSIALPNIGITKDIENLSAVDRYELDFQLDHGFYQGDLSRTQVVFGLTFRDASDKGLIVHISAFDPYGNKALDYKKAIEGVNGLFIPVRVALEPDQYQVAVRIRDRDSRESIHRFQMDVPRFDLGREEVSSPALAKSLDPVPLEGFYQPKLLVFGDWFVPLCNEFTGFRGDHLNLYQLYYNFSEKPEIKILLDDEPIAFEEKAWDLFQPGEHRFVARIPLQGLSAGHHQVKTLVRTFSNQWLVRTIQFSWGQMKEGRQKYQTRLDKAADSDEIMLTQPSSNRMEQLERVAMRAAAGVEVKHMSVFLNGEPFRERHEEPWLVDIPDGVLSISGKNTLSVVADTSLGLFKKEMELQPLLIDEQIKTRAMEIFFNAFDKDLHFLADIDFSKLEVTVDGQVIKPSKVYKLNAPITYCFLVDRSYSMKETFAENIEAVRKFIDAMRPEDRGYFVTFSDTFQQINLPTQSKSVLKAIANSITLQDLKARQGDWVYEENETFLYDAAISAMHSLLPIAGRKVMMVVSDGIAIEGSFALNAMLNYARENEIVIYSLWVDNNPQMSEDEKFFLGKEMGKGEKFARTIGLSRFFSKKDAKKSRIGDKIRKASITEGILKIMAESSGGFHYRVFKADRSLIRDYVEDIEQAVSAQFALTLDLPVTDKVQEVEIDSSEENVSIRAKSEVKVRNTNPLGGY